jgi:4-amino-4-deoxy-L-arabinose transferase-like glycosyltransferase
VIPVAALEADTSLKTRARRKLTWLRVPTATLMLLILVAFIRRPDAFWLGAAIATFGEGLQLWAASHLHKDRKFTVSGPYAHLRNPMYAGRFFVLLGFFVMPASPILVVLYVVAFAAYAQSRVGREEKRLEQIFAPHYDHYRSEVNRWLPRPRPYSRAENRRASWSQVCSNGEQVNALGLGALLAVIAMRVGLFGSELLHFPLLGEDEPRYAQVAREMFVSGDYISPRLGGLLWFEKPALLYWMEAVCYRIFGVNEFAARLPSVMGAVVAVFFLCHVVRRVFSQRASWMCGLVLATSVIWVGYGLAATPDMLLAVTVTLAILSGFAAKVEESRLEYAVVCAACTGLSMLAQGLIGPLLVVVVLGFHGLISRRSVFRNGRELLAGAVAFTAVAASWYVPVTLRHGSQFVNEFFVSHDFQQFLSGESQHPQPVWFFGAVALGGALPWTAFLLPALARARALRPRQSEQDSLLVLAWMWVLVPIAFFSFSGAKPTGYILPVFPALAILLGVEAERAWNGERTRPLRVAAALTSLVLVGCGLSVVGYGRSNGLASGGLEAALLWLPLAAGLASGTLLLLLSLRSSGRGSGRVGWSACTPAALTLSAGVVGAVLLPSASDTLSLKPLSLRVASALRPGEVIAFYRSRRVYAPLFYNEGRVIFLNRGRILQGTARGDALGARHPAEIVRVLQHEAKRGEPSLVVITGARTQGDLQSELRLQTQKIAVQDDMVALRVGLDVLPENAATPE